MDDLEVAKACAKALEIPVEEYRERLHYKGPHGREGLVSPLTDPALAFRLVGWLAERGTVFVQENHVFFTRDDEDLTEAATPADLCAAVARLVARVLESEHD